MNLVREFYDDTTDEWVLEFSMEEQEKEELDRLLSEWNISFQEWIVSMLRYLVTHPDEAAKLLTEK